MPTQEFLAFADDGGANVVTQVDYAADPLRLVGWPDGYSPPADTFNKSLRQATAMASALAQVAANITGDNILDDGNAANLIASLTKLLGAGAYDPPFDINATDGYLCIPGTPFFFQYADYSGVPGSTADIPAGMTWVDVGAVAFPKTVNVTIISGYCEPDLQNNGNMRVDWLRRSNSHVFTNGMIVSATPFTGRATALCQFTG